MSAAQGGGAEKLFAKRPLCTAAYFYAQQTATQPRSTVQAAVYKTAAFVRAVPENCLHQMNGKIIIDNGYRKVIIAVCSIVIFGITQIQLAERALGIIS